ncbi:Iron-sulfur cluster insertion protein ErpA [Serratia symbiotica]|nr:Iron-sulfur cluster insertion protein ErpA [Serratia symbiotica]
MNQKNTFPLTFTKSAVNKLQKIINNKKNLNLKLRIYIIGGGCSGFKYQFIFDNRIKENDVIIKQQNIILVVDSISLQYLLGGEIDYIETLQSSQFIVHNPNAKITCSCGSSFSI